MFLMKFSTKITLFNSYFDKNNNLSSKAILNIFQDVASFHSEQIGVGFNDMLDKNLYWVLSRVKYDIIEMPKINQTVIVETWPHEKGKIDFDRDFKITSFDGDLLLIGTSKWCVIDVVNRTLKHTNNVTYNGEYCLDKNYQERFCKICLPEKELTKNSTYIVTFGDLDRNQHMNNTNYANLVTNTIQNKKFNHFEINFNKECLQGDEIDIFYTQENGTEYIIGQVNGVTTFTALTRII